MAQKPTADGRTEVEIEILYVVGSHTRDADAVDPDEQPELFELTRDLRCFASETFEKRDVTVDEALETAYEQIGAGTIETDVGEIEQVLGDVYDRTQGPRVDDELGYNGSEHRSMSTGDMVVVDGTPHMVESIGFTEIETEEEDDGEDDDCDDGDEWDPEPAKLRDGETTDDSAHARRNAEAVRRAREELGRDVDDSDDDLETDGGEDVYGCSYCGTRTVGETDVCPDCGGDTAPVGDPDVETDGGELEDETDLHVPDDDCVLITDGGVDAELEGERVLVEEQAPGVEGEKRTGTVIEIQLPVKPDGIATYVVDLDGSGQAHLTRGALVPADEIPFEGVLMSSDDAELAYDAVKLVHEMDRMPFFDLPFEHDVERMVDVSRTLGTQLAIAGGREDTLDQ